MNAGVPYGPLDLDALTDGELLELLATIARGHGGARRACGAPAQPDVLQDAAFLEGYIHQAALQRMGRVAP